MRSPSSYEWNRRRVSGHANGFTILEVVVTLLLLGVLSAAVWVGIRSTHADVVAETHILKAHLRYAQGMAMANNTATWSVLIDASSYTLQRDGQPAPINWPGEQSPTRTLPSGVSIAQGRGQLVFCQWGCPGSPVTITVTDGSHLETIQVSSLTGLVQ